jgi:hypothetical protein
MAIQTVKLSKIKFVGTSRAKNSRFWDDVENIPNGEAMRIPNALLTNERGSLDKAKLNSLRSGLSSRMGTDKLPRGQYCIRAGEVLGDGIRQGQHTLGYFVVRCEESEIPQYDTDTESADTESADAEPADAAA